MTTKVIFNVQVHRDSEGRTSMRVSGPPLLKVYALDALLPSSDKLLELLTLRHEAKKQLATSPEGVAAHNDVVQGWTEKIHARLREELSGKATVTIDFSAPDGTGAMMTLGQTTAGVEGIWPSETNVSSTNTIRPAFTARLDQIETGWLGLAPSDVFNVRVTVAETSRWQELIRKLREELNDQLARDRKRGAAGPFGS